MDQGSGQPDSGLAADPPLIPPFAEQTLGEVDALLGLRQLLLETLDVLFQGVGRDFYAVDAKSGRVLARVQSKTAMSSTPLAYAARGKQVVAIASGSTVLAFGLP